MSKLQRVTALTVVLAFLVSLGAGSLLSGCATSRTVKGGTIGATAGAIIGGIIGKQSDHTAEGVIIGAAIGGTAGAVIGNYMDKQAAELEQDLEGAKVERVGEGIKITFDGGLLFDTNSADLRSQAQANLQEMAAVLNKYGDTVIKIDGHTDSQGSDDYNLGLSERRAASVRNYLVELSVLPDRMVTYGYGESMPVATNDTADGRQLNRRVEVAIIANEKLKKWAEDQAGQG